MASVWTLFKLRYEYQITFIYQKEIKYNVSTEQREIVLRENMDKYYPCKLNSTCYRYWNKITFQHAEEKTFFFQMKNQLPLRWIEVPKKPHKEKAAGQLKLKDQTLLQKNKKNIRQFHKHLIHGDHWA